MKSVYIAVLLSALVFVSMLTDVSACELRRRGDCCFNNGFKCCIVNNSGRQSCKQSFGKILKLNEFKDSKNSTLFFNFASGGCVIQYQGDCCYNNGRRCCRTNPSGQKIQIQCY